MPSTASASQPALSLTSGVHHTVLANGLTVLLKEVHTAPVVSVQIWYRVGSRNEAPGLNGISHQLEHLMFKGTEARPIQFGQLFSALGSASNAFTSYDMTAYYGTVSQDKLAALLILEADRLQHALINADQLDSEKRVVISELQGYDNSPDYRLSRAVMRQAFPCHPYGLPVGGMKEDVEAFTLEQVQGYYRQYYSPRNAVLVVTGDFETSGTLALIEETFGGIVSTAAPPHQTSTVRSDVESSSEPICLREPGSAALLQAVYPVPAIGHPDIPILEVMDTILTSGRSSRFYADFIDSGLASHGGGYLVAMQDPGWYEIALTAVPGQDLKGLDQVLQQTLKDLQEQGVTEAELNRAKVQLRANLILSNRDIETQASQLAYNHLVAGDYRYTDVFLAAVNGVSVADVQRVAQTYLKLERRTLGLFEPTRLEPNLSPDSGGATQTRENFMPGEPVDPATVAQYLPKFPPATVSSSQTLPQVLDLANGLRVLLLADPSTPTVTLNGYIEAGSAFDREIYGLASLTADNLLSGTQSQDDQMLARRLEERGASLDFQALREGVDIEGYALAEDLPLLLEILADVLQNATFPAAEFQISQQRLLANLQIELDDPKCLARRVLQQHLYPAEHPFYGYPTLETVAAIQPDHLQAFYQQHYRPERTVLTLLGDFDLEGVRSHLQSTLGIWTVEGEAPTLSFPAVSFPPALQTITVPLSGKTQVITYLGHPGIDRHDPRFYAALILNQVLGGDTLASRLGTEIRDRQGLTYGIYSYFAAGKQPGHFVIQMQTAPEDTQQAIDSTLSLLRHLRNTGLMATEVEAAQQSLLNSYPVELANPDILAQRVLMSAVYGLNRDEIRQFPQRLQAVTVAEVQTALQELIHPDQFVIVSAGPIAL
ncbi:insulinase family protein [Synechococcales cyanobacterium C]|uniref:Insulinase family protein n=1 Tax=Petrachloros mirabilis ULC683 TaxID=2781853 RepID=A0A8K2A732_9CYAN|nr:pitrilysin family protein [Petrachloros mirabilis]NCJ06456.1 insulinase family protein [Petrachloros mirabilis ULC683]